MGKMKYIVNIFCIVSIVCFFTLVRVTYSEEKAGHIGSEKCMTCHDDHGKEFQKSFHAKTFVKEKQLNQAEHCETCHGAGSLHAEAAGDKNAAGYATILGPKTNPKELANSCLQCHGNTHPNWKGSTHSRQGLTCNSCHNSHKSSVPGPDQGKLLKKKTSTENCFQCHKDKKAHMSKASHMPTKEGKLSCVTCHDPHGSPYAKNLKTASTRELCLTCHAEKRGPFLWEHAPVQENCLTCHDAHGSLQDKMLIAKSPFLLCQRCHVGTRHPSTLYDDSAVKQQNSRIINRSCQNCHVNIHGSNHPSGVYFMR
ncbi:MAG: DmsE family decaheme c-type cytochrome [Candidatus Firestonebacteria bacterium]